MQVVALCRRPPDLARDANIEYRMCADLADCAMADALRGAQAIVHLAALAHERATVLEKAGDYEALVRVNTAATERLAREALGAGVEHFVFLSTIGVCGEETHGAPFTEDSAPAPRSLYARSKHEAEKRLARIAAETGLRVTVFRPTLVYGPGNAGNFLRLMRVVQRGWPLPFGSVRNRRNLAYVGNVVSAIGAALRSPTAGGLFLVCDRTALSTPEVLRRLAHAMGREMVLLPMPASLLGAAAAVLGQGDAARRLLGSLEADASKLERELGWPAPF
jgi:UDP-glucose 4-epimerase